MYNVILTVTTKESNIETDTLKNTIIKEHGNLISIPKTHRQAGKSEQKNEKKIENKRKHKTKWQT